MQKLPIGGIWQLQ